MKSLAFGDYDDLKIFRVVSLWLDSSENTKLHVVLNHYLGKIPTYKFLPVLPQLIARMGDSCDTFSGMLQSLIGRVYFYAIYSLLCHKFKLVTMGMDFFTQFPMNIQVLVYINAIYVMWSYLNLYAFCSE